MSCSLPHHKTLWQVSWRSVVENFTPPHQVVAAEIKNCCIWIVLLISVATIAEIVPEVSCSLPPKIRPIAGLLTECRHYLQTRWTVLLLRSSFAEFLLRRILNLYLYRPKCLLGEDIAKSVLCLFLRWGFSCIRLMLYTHLVSNEGAVIKRLSISRNPWATRSLALFFELGGVRDSRPLLLRPFSFLVVTLRIHIHLLHGSSFHLHQRRSLHFISLFSCSFGSEGSRLRSPVFWGLSFISGLSIWLPPCITMDPYKTAYSRSSVLTDR